MITDLIETRLNNLIAQVVPAEYAKTFAELDIRSKAIGIAVIAHMAGDTAAEQTARAIVDLTA